MEPLRFTVPPQWDGALLKHFLRREVGVTARLLARLKRVDGGIQLNGKPVYVIEPIHTGDVVEFFPPSGETEAPAENLPFPVIYEDERLVAVNKPAGMPVHPSPGHDRDSLLNAFSGWLLRENRPAFAFRPLYRLDRDTTGVILLAKDGYTAAVLPATVEKEYRGICQGILTGEGTVKLPIGLEPGSRIRRSTAEDAEAPVPAVTHWKALANDGTHTLVSFRLETGRTHQIRVHMASIGHPLAGDDLYGGSREFLSQQALCCQLVSFLKAEQGMSVKQTVALPSPENWRAVFPDLFPQEKNQGNSV